MLNQLRLLARRYLSRETRRRLARLAVWPPVAADNQYMDPGAQRV